jgi:hypothetical protein
MPRTTPPSDVHGMWLSTLDFLTRNATDAWSMMMAQGIGFLAPPDVRPLPFRARAAYLAAAERKRLAEAQLFHFDAGAVKAARDVELRMQSLEHLAPSPSGLLVWAEPPYTVNRGLSVRAVSWGPAYDGGTWMQWWTDTRESVEHYGKSPTTLSINGHLTFHEEAHIPPNGWPSQVMQPGAPGHEAYRSLLGAWAAIDMGAVEVAEEVSAYGQDRKQARRLGVAARPVKAFRASGKGAGPLSPQTVVQRTVGAYAVPGRAYPGELPAELAPWHCYLRDGGHSLLVLLDPVEKGVTVPSATNATIDGQLVPVPVKAVLRAGWRLDEDGYVRTPVRYDPELGVLTDPEDDEF